MIWPSKVGMVGLSIKKNRKSISSQKNSKKGFTLVELIVVLVILAIMAAAVIPALLGYTDHAKDKKYIETAKECLKASQTVLSDTFNNSSNTISMEKRYSAADMANVYIKNYNDDPSDPKKVGTRFYVWTAKRLEATGYKSTKPDGTQSVSSGTKATTDNMGAYTIVYAAFDTGNDKYVVYDGKDWTVKEKEDIDSFNLESSANVPEKYSKNIIHMWDYVDTDACDPKGYDVAGEDWSGKEGVSLSRKVNLHFVNNKEDHGVVLASSEGGETISRDYSIFTLELNFTKEDSVIKCNECKNLRDGSEISVGESKEYLKVEEDFSDLRWSTDPATVGDRQWTEDLDDLLSQIEFPQDEESEEMEPMDIYAWTTKDIETRPVNFVVTDSGNLTPVGNTQTIEFRRYANKYDKEKADGGYSLIRDEHGATEGAFSNPTGQNGYEFAGWAHNVSGGYERDADDKLVAYSVGNETIWKAVFNTPEGQTPTFTAIGELNKTIIFKTDLHSGFGGLTQKELTVPIYKNDLTGEENDPDAIYNAAELKLDYGYKLKCWVEKESRTEFGFDFGPIKDYVIAGSADSYTFEIETEQIKGAKIIGGAYNGSGNVPSSIRSLSGTSLDKVSLFIRDSFSDGVNALGGETGIFGDIITESSEDGRLLGNLSASGNSISSTISSDDHIAVYGVSGGSISKVAVLWDGNDATYQAPIFAYSKEVGGNTEIHWFCYDAENPHVFGSLSSTFNGFNNCNFAGSDIDDWDMSECDNMASMFENCKALKTGDIVFSKWENLSKVTSMASIFKGCANMAFTAVDFTGANLSSLTTMANWVDDCANLQTIRLDRVNSPVLTTITNLTTNYTKENSKLVGFYARGWKAKSIIGFGNMFKEKYNLQTVDFSGTENDMTDLSGLTSLTHFFCFTSSDNNNQKGRRSDISLNYVSFAYTNLSNVKESKYMFVDRSNDIVEEPVTYISFEGADLSSLKNMEGMFFHAKYAETINLNTKNILTPTDCSRLFDTCLVLPSVVGLEGQNIKLDTSNVTTMENMFYLCDVYEEFDFTKLDYSKVKTMSKMVFGAGFKTIDFTGESFPALTNVSMMFGGTNYGVTDYADVEKIYFTNCTMSNQNLKSLAGLFTNCTQLHEAHFERLNAEYITNISNMFSGCTGLQKVYFDGCNLKSITTVEGLFNGSTSLELFSADGWNITAVTSLKNMFKGCSSLSTVSVNTWIMPNVTTIESMFENSGIETLSFDGCNMSTVKNINNLFRGCTSLTSFSGKEWNLSGMTSLANMFSGITSLTSVDLTKANFSGVTSNYNLFNGCSGLTSVTLDECNMSGITGGINTAFFSGCYALETVSANGWNINNCTSLSNLFDGKTSLTTVSMTDMKIDKVQKRDNNGNGGFNSMFKNCTSLTSVTINVTSENMQKQQQSLNYMFTGCSNLTTVKLEDVDFNKIQQMKYIFNDCTSYSVDSLKETFSTIDLTTDKNKLFCNHKTNDGWNTLFEAGKCHESFRSSSKIKISTNTDKDAAIAMDQDSYNKGIHRWELEVGGPSLSFQERRLNYYLGEGSTHHD